VSGGRATGGRAVAFFDNGIGDHVLTLPALRALCACFPGELELLCNERFAETFFGGLPVRALHPLRFGAAGDRLGFDAEAAAAKVAPAEVFISLNPWHSAAVDELLELLKPRRSIGFFAAFGEELPRDFTMHTADLAFTAPRALDPGLRFEEFAAPPELTAASRRAARAILDEIPSDRRVLIVHADTKPEKTWPAERFIAALDAFLERRPDFVALVLGRARLALDSGRRGEAVVACEGLPLGVSLALAAEADLFFGVDSCVLHAADFCRIPCVAVFGPTEPHEFGCRLAPAHHLTGERGMTQSISVADAVTALEAIASAWCRGAPRRLDGAML